MCTLSVIAASSRGESEAQFDDTEQPHMKNNRFWIATTVLLLSTGLYFLLDSLKEAGPLADGSMLLGATLTACGVAAGSIAIAKQRQWRAIERHMGWHSRRAGLK